MGTPRLVNHLLSSQRVSFVLAFLNYRKTKPVFDRGDREGTGRYFWRASCKSAQLWLWGRSTTALQIKALNPLLLDENLHDGLLPIMQESTATMCVHEFWASLWLNHIERNTCDSSKTQACNKLWFCYISCVFLSQRNKKSTARWACIPFCAQNFEQIKISERNDNEELAYMNYVIICFQFLSLWRWTRNG